MAEVSYEKAQLEKMRVENKLLSSELKEKVCIYMSCIMLLKEVYGSIILVEDITGAG